MKTNKYAILLIPLALLSVLIPFTVLASDGGVFGTEYVPDESGTIYAMVLDGDGAPVNDATVTLTLWASDGSKELDGVSMTYIAGSQGVYKYDFTAPADDGVYLAEVTTANPTGYGAAEVHVIEPVSCNTTFTGNVTLEATIDADTIWGANMTDYTDTATFGGFFNITIGGGDMTLLQLIFIVLLVVVAFWQKGWLRAIPSLGIIAWGAATVSYDVKIGIPLIALGLMLFILGILRVIEGYRQSQES